MVCLIHCAIAFVLLAGMVYLSFAVDKSAVTQSLMNELNDAQKLRYLDIIQKRRSIYLTGFTIGLFLSVVAISMQRSYGWSSVCLAGMITLLTVYFYYVLSPKPDLMVVYLDTEKQRQIWAEIYRKMTFHYHVGLLLGVIAVMVFMRGLCNSSSL